MPKAKSKNLSIRVKYTYQGKPCTTDDYWIMQYIISRKCHSCGKTYSWKDLERLPVVHRYGLFIDVDSRGSSDIKECECGKSQWAVPAYRRVDEKKDTKKKKASGSKRVLKKGVEDVSVRLSSE